MTKLSVEVEKYLGPTPIGEQVRNYEWMLHFYGYLVFTHNKDGWIVVPGVLFYEEI